jgi:TorA maturation chaperone TorD
MRTKVLWALMVGAALLGGLAAPLEASSSQDKAIIRAFEDVLDREPTDRELRRYRDLMYEEHWTERDIREDLRSRSDYQRNSQRRVEDPDRVVRRAYQDILHREPDAEGLRLYRSRMIDQDWTEQDVREALRKSPEYAQRSSESADKMIRRAYQDILGREADTNGLYSYRNKVMNQGWDEHDVREALRRSPEYRQKSAMTREQAEEIVRRAYQSVLGRDPDPGSRGYVDRVLKEHWTEKDVARELRNSDEYRNRQP